jgi:serine/threonine protein kinase
VLRGLQPGDPLLIGPYRLVGQLGSGGMGQVFLGLSAGGRAVAVKVVRAELAADQEFRIRFGREVTASRRVSGLFTALVIDADVDGPVPWLATAYVSGPSLSDAVTRYGPMPAPSVRDLAAGLAEALSAIHAAAVVHCDLKPSNVLLSRDGPRVIDFGISRAVEAISVPGAGLVVGSPGFMSPEQAMAEEVGPPSDVFSLGAVLAFAATGHGPFGEGSGPELAYRLVYGEPGLDQIPAALRPLIRHCLAKEPGERPTADELLTGVAALRPTTDWLPDVATGAFAGYLTPGPPPSGRDRLPRRRWWRPLAVAGVAASVLAASAAAGFALSGAVRHPSAAQPQPKDSLSSPAEPGSGPAATSPPGSSGRPASSPSVLPGPAPAGIFPAIDTLTSRGTSTRTAAAPSPAKSSPAKSSPAKSPPAKSPTASASPTISPPPLSPSPSPSPTPSPSASTSSAPPGAPATSVLAAGTSSQPP